MSEWSYSSHLAQSFSVSHFLQSLAAASVLSHEPLSHFAVLSHEPLSHFDFLHSAASALNSTSVSLPSLSASCLVNASSSLAVHSSADLWHFSVAHFFSADLWHSSVAHFFSAGASAGVSAGASAGASASAFAVNESDSDAAASSSNFFMIICVVVCWVRHYGWFCRIPVKFDKKFIFHFWVKGS